MLGYWAPPPGNMKTTEGLVVGVFAVATRRASKPPRSAAASPVVRALTARL